MTDTYFSQQVLYLNSRRHKHRLGVTLHRHIHDPIPNVGGRILYVPSQEDRDYLIGLLILEGYDPDSRDVRVKEPNTKLPSYVPFIENGIKSYDTQ